MIPKNTKYRCTLCEHIWRAGEYRPDEGEIDFHNGGKCPQCDCGRIVLLYSGKERRKK